MKRHRRTSRFLMYRPLYLFGTNGQVQLNTSLSLADTPVQSSDGKSANRRHQVFQSRELTFVGVLRGPPLTDAAACRRRAGAARPRLR
jgi:hypothetical protein